MAQPLLVTMIVGLMALLPDCRHGSVTIHSALEPCSTTAEGTNETRLRYEAANVAFDATCTSETQTRTCTKGQWTTWTGTFTADNCVVDSPPAGCGSIPNGGQEGRPCYTAPSVPHGQTCTFNWQTRTCEQGNWNPDWPTCNNLSCTELPGQACGGTPDGGGEARYCYTSATVPFGTQCNSTTQTRTCDNGAWSPDWPACSYLSCKVLPGFAATRPGSAGASFPLIDRPSVYDYSPSAFWVEDSTWRIWHCGHNVVGTTAGDSVFVTALDTGGASVFGTVPIIAFNNNDPDENGRHACAPTAVRHANSIVRAGASHFNVYFECARRYYPEDANDHTPCDGASYVGPADPPLVEGPTQICLAATEAVDAANPTALSNPANWKIYNAAYWSTNFDFAPPGTAPTAIVVQGAVVNTNINYTLCNSRHWCKPNVAGNTCIDMLQNYGVGQPSAIVMDYSDATHPNSQQVWLYYYDSRGAWNERGMYLAKSWDGFHFDTPIPTNVRGGEVKFFPTGDGKNEIGGGSFVSISAINGKNVFAYSTDGVNFLDLDGDSLQVFEIPRGDASHCVAAAPSTIVSSSVGHLHDWYVNVLSNEGYLSTAEGGQGFGCYNAAEDSARGSTWGIWLVQGTLTGSP